MATKPPHVPDYRLKPLQLFYRPYFSPLLNSWEMDWFEVNLRERKKQLFGCININTKYLFIIPLDEGTTNTMTRTRDCLSQIQKELVRLFGKQSKIKYLRADGAIEFGTQITNQDAEYVLPASGDRRMDRIQLGYNTFVRNSLAYFFDREGIQLSLFPSPFTNKNRVIDRAIRTIRDRIGENPRELFYDEVVLKVVNEYNNTPHSAFGGVFTPLEVQSCPDLEECFIRDNLYKLDEAKKKQQQAGFFTYEKGDVLIIHQDQSKLGFGIKNRRSFNRLAIFNYYEHGNVNCNVLQDITDEDYTINKAPIVVPIYYTKFIADGVEDVPKKYYSLLSEVF
jgi:hypothetical protein